MHSDGLASTIGALLARAPSAGAALQEVSAELSRVAAGATCDIWLWRAEGGEPLLVRAASSSQTGESDHDARRRLDPILIEARDDGSSEGATCLPLGPLGYLLVDHRGPCDASLRAELAAAAACLSHALLAQVPQPELLSLAEWLALRNEFDRASARRIASVKSLPELGEAVMRLAEPLFQIEYSGIYFIDTEDGRLHLVQAKGLTDAERAAAEATALERHPGEVLRTGRAVDIHDTTLAGEPLGHGRPVLSRVYLPVFANGHVVGTIGFASSARSSFDSRHREVLAFLCDLAGQAYARISAERGASRRGELVEIGASIVERLFAAPDWRQVTHAVLGMIGGVLRARTVALVEQAEGVDLYGIAPPQEFVWQPHFGAPWPGAGCFTRLDDALRARLSRGEAVDVPAADGAPEVHAKPVIVEGVLWGLLLFEAMPGRPREPDRAERSALRSLANAFGHAIGRERLDTALRQRQKMEAIGVLASGIAQDFNSLLWPIMLYSEMLERSGGVDERGAQMLRDMQQAARRASELVQQVLAISRRRDRALELVHAAEVAIDASRFVTRGLPANIRLDTDIDADAGYLLGDASSLYQTVVHLLTNAVEAMDRRAGAIKLSLDRVERDTRAWIRITITDQGVGLDAETRSRIFEPYFSTRTEQGGVGLGLTFVQRVVSEMEGRIAVESEQGRGTTIAVLLPVGGEMPGHDPVEQVAAAEPIATTPDAPAARRGERVLFVDDDASVLDVGRQMLESLGYEVTARSSAMEALELLADASNEYELLLTDLTMPGMTGIDLARETRGLRPRLPIVCCTGFGDEKTERSALAAGMNAFVRKPIDFDTFATTIRTTIDRFGAPRA